MTASADIFNSSTRSTDPITLSEIAETIERASTWATNAVQCAEEAIYALGQIDRRLADRIERNRQRSARNRTKTPTIVHTNGNGNGHSSHVAVKLTSHGVMLICRSCGGTIA